MINNEQLLKEFTEEQLTIPYSELPKKLLSNARYSLARLFYEKKHNIESTVKVSYSDYLKNNKNKKVGFCQYILQNGV